MQLLRDNRVKERAYKGQNLPWPSANEDDFQSKTDKKNLF